MNLPPLIPDLFGNTKPTIYEVMTLDHAALLLCGNWRVYSESQLISLVRQPGCSRSAEYMARYREIHGALTSWCNSKERPEVIMGDNASITLAGLEAFCLEIGGTVPAPLGDGSDVKLFTIANKTKPVPPVGAKKGHEGPFSLFIQEWLKQDSGDRGQSRRLWNDLLGARDDHKFSTIIEVVDISGPLEKQSVDWTGLGGHDGINGSICYDSLKGALQRNKEKVST